VGKHIEGAPKEHGALSYSQVGNGRDMAFMARLAPRTYCAFPNEELLKNAIDLHHAKTRVSLPSNLKPLLDRVGSHDHYLAVADLGALMKGLPIPMLPVPDLSALAVGATIGTSVDLEVVVVFGSEEGAKTVAEMVEGQIKSVSAMMESQIGALTGKEKEAAQTALEIIRSLDISRSGSRLTFEARARTSSIESLIDMALQSMPAPGRPPHLPVRPTGVPKFRPPDDPRVVTPKGPAAGTPVREPKWK